MTWVAISIAGSTLIGTASQANTNAMNASEAEKNRQWQERMSNTAYQRASADMTAAGINPILAHNPAGFGGGAQATMVAPEMDLTQMAAARQQDQRIKNETDKLDQDILLTKAVRQKTIQDTDATVTENALGREKIETQKAITKAAQADATTAIANLPAQLKEAEIRNKMAYPDAVMKRINDVIRGAGTAKETFEKRPTETIEEHYNSRGEMTRHKSRRTK